MDSDHYCSFCGKSDKEARWMIAGPSVFICDECVETCRDMIGKLRLEAVKVELVEVKPPQSKGVS